MSLLVKNSHYILRDLASIKNCSYSISSKLQIHFAVFHLADIVNGDAMLSPM